MAWRGIVGKNLSIDELKTHLLTTGPSPWRPSFVVIHNTSAPDMALFQKWKSRKNWSHIDWMRNLSAYYAGMGWSGGPHFFVCPDGTVDAFTPITMPGTHSPSWNNRSIGIETVGEFDREPFDGVIRDTLIACAALVHHHFGLDPVDYKLGVRGLHFHREDPKTTHKSCPGRNMNKVDVVSAIAKYIERLSPGDMPHIPQAVAEAPASKIPYPSLTSVKYIQKALNLVQGANLRIDDVLGKETIAAIKRFQVSHPPLKADGIAGPLTHAVILAEVEKKLGPEAWHAAGGGKSVGGLLP